MYSSKLTRLSPRKVRKRPRNNRSNPNTRLLTASVTSQSMAEGDQVRIQITGITVHPIRSQVFADMRNVWDWSFSY